jgi:hypothetical protein
MDRPLSHPVPDDLERDAGPWQAPRKVGAVEPMPAWAEKLTRWLDDAVRIPGTEIRFGLDSIIGFFLPGAGDALTAVGSVSLLFLALRSGVPTVVIGRMVLNIAIDSLVGAVPFVGDLFDVAWKANRKNYQLIEHYKGDPDAKPAPGDYLLVGVGLLLVVLSVLLPILFLLSVGVSVGSLFGN